MLVERLTRRRQLHSRHRPQQFQNPNHGIQRCDGVCCPLLADAICSETLHAIRLERLEFRDVLGRREPRGPLDVEADFSFIGAFINLSYVKCGTAAQ